MSSYRQVYTEGVDKLFDTLNDKRFANGRGAQTPQEQGQPATLVPFSFSGSGVIASNEPMDILIYVPDVVIKVIDAQMVVKFREFYATATTTTSGGGSTSGSGGASAPTSSATAAHRHRMMQWDGSASGEVIDGIYNVVNSAGVPFRIGAWTDNDAVDVYTFDADGAHDHSVSIPAHDHTTPAHSHDLDYGVVKEALPATWAVRIRIYEWDGSTWTQIGTAITNLDSEVEDVDLGDRITGPGKYKIEIENAGGQPNGGRIAFDAAGYVVGAMQQLQP